MLPFRKAGRLGSLLLAAVSINLRLGRSFTTGRFEGNEQKGLLPEAVGQFQRGAALDVPKSLAALGHASARS